MDLDYAGKLFDSKAKASLSFNARNELVSILIWLPEGDGENLLNLAVTSLKIKYKSLNYQEDQISGHRWFKYFKSDAGYSVTAKVHSLKESKNGVLFINYGGPGKGYLWECRRTIPEL